jgi:hypothetical protein
MAILLEILGDRVVLPVLTLFMANLSISDTKITTFQYYATHNTIFFIVVGGR